MIIYHFVTLKLPLLMCLHQEHEKHQMLHFIESLPTVNVLVLFYLQVYSN